MKHKDMGKAWKKIAAVVLTAAMVFGTAGAVFATSPSPVPGSAEAELADASVVDNSAISEDSFQITITDTQTTNSTAHTYRAYQIFTGDLKHKLNQDGSVDESHYDDDNKTLSNINWGSGVNMTAAGYTALESALEATAGSFASAQDVAKALDGATATKARAFADAIKPYLTEEFKIGTAAKKENPNAETANVVIKDLDPGYYLVMDTPDSLANAEDEAYTKYILQVLGNVTMKAKASIPSVEKKVQDTNDSLDATANTDDYNSTGAAIWKDSADYDIGDKVPFKLTATLADNVSSYKKYHITFVDTLESGKFDAISELTIKIDGVAIGSVTGYEVTAKTVTPVAAGDYVGDTNLTTSGFTRTVQFEPQTGDDYLPADLDGAEVTVEFTATLGVGANIGQSGNVNTVQLEYSNNPNPEDTVIVFTYQTIIHKKGPSNADLEGADFRLEKKIKSYTITAGDVGKLGYYQEGNQLLAVADTGKTYVRTTTGSILLVDVADKELNGNVEITVSPVAENGLYHDVWMTVDQDESSTSDSKFVWKGIDDGEYMLTEIQTPTGYNSVAPQTFTVEATHAPEAADLDKETKKYNGNNYVISELKPAAAANAVVTGTVSTGTLEGNVENKPGAVLPSTGGVGTTMFYVIGAILVIGAGVVLVTRRRMAK